MGHQNANKLIYSETLHKTESPQKKFLQHDTLGENLRGWGGSGRGGVCVTYPLHHHPTPDTQT